MGNQQLAPGSIFANRFEIDGQAGSGGMGTIYRARDGLDGSIVALKLLHPGVGGASEGERFEREAQLLSELRHPGIVAHVAHGVTSTGQRYLAMEWLEGTDLGHHLIYHSLSLADSVSIIEQVVEALSVAHRRGIIHRDLKPTNLFLCEGDVRRVKLLDFGIARRVAASRAMTRTGMVVGTPEYMAPEQARASRELTLAADYFSLGCVFYECLTGQPPFFADHIAAVLVRILFEEPAPIEVCRPGIPESLTAIVSQLLCKDPDKRLADATLLRQLLRELGTLPEPALVPTAPQTRLKPESFAEQEQALFSIVLAAPPEGAMGFGTTLSGNAVPLADTDRQMLVEALSPLFATPEFLANGTLLVTVSSVGSAQDQAMQAARAALLIKERWPATIVSMATGRGMVCGDTAVGEVVDVAARLLKSSGQQAGSPLQSGIFMDQLSARLLAGRFAQTPRPDGALLRYEERDPDESRLLLGKPTPCIGREAELGTLESLLSGCIEESVAGAAIVVAPPGTGKSRLRHEFLRRIEQRGETVTVISARGDLLQAGAAYRILSRAIRSTCGIGGDEPLSTQQRLLQDRIERHLPASDKSRVLPLLGELCGVPFSDEEYPILKECKQAPKMLPDRIRRAFLTWLAAECQAAPVLLVLDDLHWGDGLTVGLVSEALKECKSCPLFVLALARPEIHVTFPSLWKNQRPHEIALKGLSKRACERLIQQALGKQISAESMAWMAEQSAGNAFFLEELIRAAADGQLEKRPDTVIAMLQSRIGALETGARRAALAAAIFGQTFPGDGVAHVLGLGVSNEEVEGWLFRAAQAELIETHGLFEDQKEYGFRHALVQEAAYSLLSEHDRKLGHERAADHFARASGDNVPHALLGHHYREAGLFEKALRAYREAGDSAAKRFLHEEAMLHYQRADEVLRLLPESSALRRQQADLLISQVQCSFTSAAPPVTMQRLEHARELLIGLRSAGEAEPQDGLREARIDYEQGRLHTFRNQYAKAGDCFDRVLPVALEFGDEQLGALARAMYGRKLTVEGQITRAIDLLEPAVTVLEDRLGMGIETARAYSYLAIMLAEGGRGHASLRHLDRLEKWIEDQGDLAYPRLVEVNRCFAFVCVCDFPAGLRSSQRALEFASRANEPLLLYVTCDLAAWLHCRNGDLDTALSHRQRALEVRARHGSAFQKELFDAIHAEILLQRGDLEGAKTMAEQTAECARADGSMWALPLAERTLGCALAKLGAEDAAVDARLGESLTVALQVGNVMAALETELAWADVFLERRDRATARTYLNRAQTRLSDDMLPCTRDHFMPLIQQRLQRCTASN